MSKVILKNEISKGLRKARRNVFVRNDFAKFGGYDQVGRVLKRLADDGQIIKLGYGVYVKARPNRFTGKPMIAAKGGFDQVAKEALKRLNVKFEISEIEKSYQAGSSTQIPGNTRVQISKRFSRKIATDKFELEVARA